MDLDATQVTTEKSNCTHCATMASTRQWNPRTLRQGLCKRGYAEAKAAGTLPARRLPKGEKRQCEAAIGTDRRCPNDAKAHGLCPSHVARRYRGAEVDAPLRDGAAQAPGCTFDGCDRPMHADGLCAGHDTQRKRGRPLAPLRAYKKRGGVCSADRCGRDVYTDGVCVTHYERRRSGDPDWARPIRPKGKHGEGYITNDGYKIVYVNGRKVREHMYVMEQHIGRKLLPKEQVHHKTGGFAGRSNNALDNLELWTKQHPTGHRVEDVIRYTFEQQDLYLDLMDPEMLATLAALGERAASRMMAAA